jgi:DNA-binding CsgD family transcriptional regulator
MIIGGSTSDGFHTFNELYDYRLLYNAALFNEWASRGVYDTHKSLRHATGEECFDGGWFVVMSELPTGQISNHYKIEYWDYFSISVRRFPNEWDGHTSAEAAERLRAFIAPSTFAPSGMLGQAHEAARQLVRRTVDPAPDAPASAPLLTARQTQVLQHVARGMTNGEIAMCLDLRTDTVKSHLRHIARKLGTGNRTTIVVRAIRAGIIS